MKKKKILMLLILLVLLVGGVVFGVTRGLPWDPDARPKSSQDMTWEEWQAYLQGQADASQLRFQVNSYITVEPDGKADLLLKNAAENHINFQAELALSDGTVLYQSGVLSPGEQQLVVELTEWPDPGEYTATVTIQALDPESGAVTGQAKTEVKLQVKEVRP